MLVDRPFFSLVEERADDDVPSRRVSRLGVLAIDANDEVRVLATSPTIGTSDLRPDAVLEDAVESGIAERREVREIAGRRCQVYRLGSSASDGTLVPLGAIQGEHADVCVDRGGLVLEEWWVQHGDPLRRRVAVDVEVGVDVDTGFRLPGEDDAVIAPSDGRINPTETGPSFTLDVPTGFRLQGRYEITAAQLSPPGTSEVPPPRQSVAAVWTDGADLLVLEESVRPIGAHPYAQTVEIVGIGPAELIPDLRSSELRLETAAGATVRLYGTVAPSALVELASSLTANPT